MSDGKVFGNVYRNKKVLVTGHTGFKGAWLTIWLLKMGARVIGVSKDIPTTPSMFKTLSLEDQIAHYFCDVRDLKSLNEIFEKEKPDFVFHLAAQPIVSVSYTDPVETITSNAIGTMNVLEVLRNYEDECTVVMITSDKCYDNVESIFGYRETDALGGKDVYSGSKGMAELVIKSYVHSFLLKKKNIKIAVGRAGNVIGGGDWAKDRIVVDCVNAWSEGRKVEIRSPHATRPWQHVLEPLSGYLLLAELLFKSENKIQGEPFNFGPRAEQNRSVIELITDLADFWGFSSINDALEITGNIPFHEAGLLKLNCDKGLFWLKWQPTLNYEETIQLVGNWYYAYYQKHEKMFDLTVGQIQDYESIALNRNSIWSNQE